jgi:hypothetical protein
MSTQEREERSELVISASWGVVLSRLSYLLETNLLFYVLFGLQNSYFIKRKE